MLVPWLDNEQLVSFWAMAVTIQPRRGDRARKVLERAAQPQCICTNASPNFSGSPDLRTLMLLALVACDKRSISVL